MPFKSEKQRKYLWANEPEIARDWTNRYGAANGGIMHQFENYAHDDGNNVSVPRSFQARPHSDQVNLAYITPQEQGILQALKPDTPHEGPMGIPNYDSFDAAGNYTSGATMSGMETGAKNERSRADRRAAGISPQEAQDIRSSAINAGAGQVVNRGWFGPKYNQTVGVGDIAAAKAFRNNPNNRFAKQAYRNTRGSNFGIGNLLRGAMSIFGGVPGSMMSMLSRIDPRQLRGWNEEEGRYNTQKEYEDARTNRRRQSRLDNLYRRKSLGKGFSQKNIDMLEAMGLKPSTAQNVLTGRDLNLRGKELTNKLSANNYDWNKRIATHSSMHPYHTETTPAGWRMMKNAGDGIMSTPQGTSFNNPVGGVDQYAREMEALEKARAGDTVSVNELGGTLQDFYTNRNPRTNANTQFDVWDDNINFTNNSIRNNMKMMEIANNPALSRYKKTQEFAPTKFNDPWAGATVQQAKVMPKQKQQMKHDLPYLESGVYTVEDMWNNAKTWDDTGSKGFWGMGKKEAEPMTKEEFNQELKDQGYTGKGLAVKDGGRIGYGAGGLASLWPR